MAKQYVVTRSGTNVTFDGRTITVNEGTPLPEGIDAEQITHLLDVDCIAELKKGEDPFQAQPEDNPAANEPAEKKK